MPSVLLWAYSAEKSFLILQIRNDCGHSGFAFSRGGVVVPSVCFTPWSGVRIPLTTAPASLPCFRRWRRSAQLQFPYGLHETATTVDIPTGWDLQQRRPRPVADAGRSCWGSGQQDARAAQGTRGCWEPQSEALKKSPLGSFLPPAGGRAVRFPYGSN